jgi:hypothetical protein
VVVTATTPKSRKVRSEQQIDVFLNQKNEHCSVGEAMPLVVTTSAHFAKELKERVQAKQDTAAHHGEHVRIFCRHGFRLYSFVRVLTVFFLFFFFFFFFFYREF